MMTYGSTFSGIGGLDIAVEHVFGARPLWHVEPDPYASAVLAKHWPGVPNLGRIEEVDKHVERPDIICGGFPCQDISPVGLRAGIHGGKSGLWWQLARAIGEVRPSIVVLENVADLVFRGLSDVVGELSRLGFDAEWSTFRASYVGAPHARNRAFVVALAHDNRERLKRLYHEEHQGQGSKPRDVVDGRDARAPWPPARRDVNAWARWNGAKPGVRRSAYGVPRGVDARRRRERIKRLGNAVVPAQAAAAIEELWGRLVA